MPAKTIAMEPLKQALQLYKDGITKSEIARRLNLSRNTVKKYLRRAPDNNDPKKKTTDAQLSDQLYHTDHNVAKDERHKVLLEHFNQVQDQLHKTGVNRMLLHEEYLLAHPNGYKYTQYCLHFSTFLKRKDVVMHLEHQPADQLMIDFAGDLLHYVHPDTGEMIYCQVFVAVLPHSGITFCYAVHSQKIPDFVECCVQAMHYFGGAPMTVLCDNLKTAVTRSCKVEPVFTQACYQLSHHYNTTFAAARPYSPRDKAMVERSVNIIYTQVYARLRKITFTSINELNAAIRIKVDELNNKRYRGSSFSRRQLFEQKEKGLLKPLPPRHFQLKNVSSLTVQNNYHIELRSLKKYFSVPYIYAFQAVKVLWDNHTVEIYLKGHRIALHYRDSRHDKYYTDKDHMPPQHAHALEIKGLSEEKLIAMAKKVGDYAIIAIKKILAASTYPQQAFKSCRAIILLQKQYDKERVNMACAHALIGTRVDYTTIKSILKTGKEKDPLLFTPEPEKKPAAHANIRGAAHYC